MYIPRHILASLSTALGVTCLVGCGGGGTAEDLISEMAVRVDKVASIISEIDSKEDAEEAQGDLEEISHDMVDLADRFSHVETSEETDRLIEKNEEFQQARERLMEETLSLMERSPEAAQIVAGTLRTIAAK